jgi:hypothetical protein
MKLTTEVLEKLKLITLYNEKILEKVEGDQNLAVGLITFTDEIQGVSVWNPFYDSSLRFDVIPTEEYTEKQLQIMLDQIHPKEEVNTGGNCMVNFYKVKVDSDVKCIVVNDECIVGYSDVEPYTLEIPTEIWVFHL